MFIVIHRMKKDDLARFRDELVDSVIKKSDMQDRIAIRHSGTVIDIAEKHQIMFWCGDVFRMAGIRPDIYNVDSEEASEFLSQSAAKVFGCELNDRMLFEEVRKLCTNN